jgi:uncharacterized protein YidB (DUF937 family)
MGMFDELTKGGSLGGVADWAVKHPQVVAAAVGLLSTRAQSAGTGGGLAGLVAAFERSGMGSLVTQWVATGPNPPVTPDQLSAALGPDVLAAFAQKAGLGQADANAALAGLLPTLVDHLTPQGRVPEPSGLEGALGSLLSNIGH